MRVCSSRWTSRTGHRGTSGRSSRVASCSDGQCPGRAPGSTSSRPPSPTCTCSSPVTGTRLPRSTGRSLSAPDHRWSSSTVPWRSRSWTAPTRALPSWTPSPSTTIAITTPPGPTSSAAPAGRVTPARRTPAPSNSPSPTPSARSSRTGWRNCPGWPPAPWTDALDRVPGGFGGVGPSGGRSPPEGPVGELFDLPAGVLFDPVVVSALRARVAQAGPAACFVRGVVLEVAGRRRSSADGAGARRVPDPGQVPELDPGIMSAGLGLVVAVLRGEGVDGDDQVRAVAGDPQDPGPVAAGWPVTAGGDEREPRSVAF